MNIKKFSKVVCLLAGITLMSTGCRKYLDVNTNPNVSQDAGPEFLLPSAQIYLASAVGTELQINGSIWAQFWTQAPSASQYKIYEQYTPTASNYDRPWQQLYANCLEDLDQVERKAAANNQIMYVAIAKLMKAYTFQVITDGWGDVPYSQALKGEESQGGIVSPKFDPQSQVYDSIINMAQQGLAIMNTVPAGSTVTGDLIYTGTTQRTNWIKFGNTLLLKMYLRLSEKNPAKAQAGVAALYASGPTFIGGSAPASITATNASADAAQVAFISTAGNQNPLYSEIVGLSKTQNLVASSTVLDSMTKGNVTTPADARATAFFKPATTGYVGLRQGFYTASPSTAISIPNANTGADANNTASATAPVKFITTYESQFLQAEAVARGWASSSASADSLFRSGIRYSFAAYGLAASSAAYISSNSFAQYPGTGSIQQKIRQIIVQKWFSMTGNQGFEAWTEWRRTGYPEWLHYSVNSVIGFTDAILPRRLLYPDVEVQRNQNFPGQKQVTDRVYWDVH